MVAGAVGRKKDFGTDRLAPNFLDTGQFDALVNLAVRAEQPGRDGVPHTTPAPAKDRGGQVH
jgi:hypothetical protein